MTPHLVLTKLATNVFALLRLTDPDADDPSAYVSGATVTVTLRAPDGTAIFENEVCAEGAGASVGRYRYGHVIAANWADGAGYEGEFVAVLPSGAVRTFPFTAEVQADG